METFKRHKMINPDFYDIRQSEEWSKYLASFGWKSLKLCGDITMNFRPMFFGGLAKIQHPRNFSKKELLEIEEICKQNKIGLLKIEPWLAQDLKVLEDCNFIVSRTPQCAPKTMWMDLSLSLEDHLKNISHSGKYSLNRARREGSYTEFYKNPTDAQLKLHYALARETGKEKKFYVQSLKEFIIRRDIFKDRCYISAVFDKDKNIASSKFYLATDTEVLYVSGGTSSLGRKQKGGYLLMWDSIEYFKNEGYKVFDLEGLNDSRFKFFTKDWGGFSHFKEKFGGETIEFPLPYIKYYGAFFKFVTKSRLLSF